MGNETCRKPNEHHNGYCPTCGSWCNWCPDTPSARLALTEQVKRLADAVEGITTKDGDNKLAVRIIRVSP